MYINIFKKVEKVLKFDCKKARVICLKGKKYIGQTSKHIIHCRLRHLLRGLTSIQEHTCFLKLFEELTQFISELPIQYLLI